MSTSRTVIQVDFIHKSVITSCRISGVLNSWPVSPISSLMFFPEAWSRKPIRSWGWFDNLSSIWMCTNVCSVKIFGMFMSQNLSGPWASTWGNVGMNLVDGSPCANIGDMIEWHCIFVNVVARRGYTNLHRRTFCRLNKLSEHPNLEFFIFCCQSLATSSRYASLVSMLPLGAKQTPSVWWALEGSSHCTVVWHLSVSRRVIEPVAWCHFR